MPSVPPTPSTYPARPGTIIDFDIVRDFGTRVMHDAEYHFARILLNMGGREVTASFSESEFARLNGHRGPIRATAGQPVFLRGPTSYMNPDAIAAADAQFRQTADQRLAEYDRQMMAYRSGQVATRPEYPDLEKIPYWKPDYVPHPPTGSVQPGAVLHLDNPHLPPIPRSVSKPLSGRFGVFGKLFGRIPVIGTVVAGTLTAATGANAREIAEAAARATPLVGAGMALAKGQFEEAGARLVGDFTLGIGEQVLKEALPNSGMEPGLLTQQAAVRAEDLKDPVAVNNPPVWENPRLLKQGERSRANHGQKFSDSGASKQLTGPKI